MVDFGYTLMTEQAGPDGPGAARRGGGARRLRLRGHERPLLSVARRAGACPERVERARRRDAGDRAGGPDDLRDVPDHAVPPRGGRTAGGDRATVVRQQVHARASARGRTSTSTWSAGAGRRSTSATRCWSRPCRSSPRCSTAVTSTSPATTSGWTRPSCGTCRTSACRSPSRCPVTSRSQRFAPLADAMIAVEPDAALCESWTAAGSRGRPQDRAAAGVLGRRPRRRGPQGARAVPLVRRRLEGQRRTARPGRLRGRDAVRHRGRRGGEHPVRQRRRRASSRR